MLRHYYQITFRGTIDLAKWNNLLRYLFNSGIEYVTETNLSPTRDDAGLPKYFDRVIFSSERDIHFDFAGYNIKKERGLK